MEALNVKKNGIYVDATLGGGGHTRAILEALGGTGHLYGFDQDSDAIANAPACENFTAVASNFRYIKNFMRYYGVEGVDGILADLGVSFHHFDEAERGFSFREDAILDMRMNRGGSLTAEDVLNDYSEDGLAEVLHLYGEVRNARRVASAIVKARRERRIRRVSELVSIINEASPANRRYGVTGADRKELACIFQALRIEVNDELGALRTFLQKGMEVLKPEGRFVVISYHSLEDRMVKEFFKGEDVKLYNKKVIVPDEAEVEQNPRCRSAKMRAIIKL